MRPMILDMGLADERELENVAASIRRSVAGTGSRSCADDISVMHAQDQEMGVVESPARSSCGT